MKLLNISEVVKLLRVSSRTWFRLVDEGKAPAPVKIRRCVRWQEDDIIQWINRNKKIIKTNKKDNNNQIISDENVKYSISEGQFWDGKSVCLWRESGIDLIKIARFQSDETARMFAEDFNFPLSDNVKKRIFWGL